MSERILLSIFNHIIIDAVKEIDGGLLLCCFQASVSKYTVAVLGPLTFAKRRLGRIERLRLSESMRCGTTVSIHYLTVPVEPLISDFTAASKFAQPTKLGA